MSNTTHSPLLTAAEWESMTSDERANALDRAPMPAVAYTVQDGEMFYVHTDREGEVYVAFRQCPLRVEYYNTDDAAKAREWLVAEYPATQFTFI